MNDAATVTALHEQTRDDQQIVDLVGMTRKPGLRAQYEGLCW